MRVAIWCVLALMASPLSAATLSVKTTGGTYPLSAAGLTSALTDAVCGDIITVEAGKTITGTFTLPLKTCQVNPITITSDASAGNLPGANVRTGPQYAPFMPKIVSSGNGIATLRTANNTRGWILKHIEFPPVPQGFGNIITIGSETGGFTSIEPSEITITQCYIHGDPIFGQKRGISLNGHDLTVTYNHLENFTGQGQDTMGINSINGSGGFTITDNYIEAGTYSIMFGGGDPRNRTWLVVTGSASTTGAAVDTTETGHTLAELAAGMRLGIMTPNGIRFSVIATVTGAGASGSITWSPAIDTVPAVGDRIRRDNVPKNITVLRNVMTKDPLWRTQGFLPPTPEPTNTSTAGTGSLAAGTYYYHIQAYKTGGGYQGATVFADPSDEYAVTVGANGRVTFTVPTLTGGATAIRLFRCSSSGATSSTACVRRGYDPAVTTLVDDGGTSFTALTRPTEGSRPIIKNNFENKVGDTVTVSGNVLEYNWSGDGGEGQSLWIKSVNQDGNCFGCYTADVTISNNLIRSTAGWLNISSRESYANNTTTCGSGVTCPAPQPIDGLTITNNLIYDCGAPGSVFTYSSGGIRQASQAGPVTDLAITHNTIACEMTGSPSNFYTFTNSSTSVSRLGTSTGLTISYNIGFENRYGVFSEQGTGTTALGVHAPGYTFAQNVVADASCGSYPATTICTAGATVKGYFTNYNNAQAGGNFALTGATPLDGAAPGPSDIGADIAAITAAIAGTGSGAGTSPPDITKLTLVDGVLTVAYTQTLTATSGTAPYTWSITGTLPTGLSRTGAVISGTPTVAGTYNFSATVTDSTSGTALTDTHAYTVVVHAAVAISTGATLTGGTVGVAYSNTIAITGDYAPYAWTVTSGALPGGVTLNALTGELSGTPTTAAAHSFTLTVTGAGGSTANRAFTLAVGAVTSGTPAGRPRQGGSLQLQGNVFFGSTEPTCAAYPHAAEGDVWLDTSGLTPAIRQALTTCPTALAFQDVVSGGGETVSIDASQVVSGTLSADRLPIDVGVNGSLTVPELYINSFLQFAIVSCTQLAPATGFRLCVDTDNQLKYSVDGTAYATFGGTVASDVGMISIAIHTRNATGGTAINDQTNAEQELLTSSNRFWFDGTDYTQVNISMRVQNASASANTPKCYARYEPTGDATPASWTTIVGADVSLAAIGTIRSTGWAPLPPSARGWNVWAIWCSGGDGASDWQLGNLQLQFK